MSLSLLNPAVCPSSSQDDKPESVTSSSVPASSRPQESPYIDPRPSQGHAPRNPLSIGDDDLAPNFGGFAPHAGGGMIMGPDHPLFGGRGSGSSWDHGGLAVPPGARFDPIGPFGQPGRPLGPGRGRGRGGSLSSFSASVYCILCYVLFALRYVLYIC